MDLKMFWNTFSSQGYNNSKGVTLEASFTPDSQFVMIGKKDHVSACYLLFEMHFDKLQVFFCA